MPRIDPDAWDDWTAHPITEALMRFCRVRAEAQQVRWLDVSWHGGQADPITLARLQERAATFVELAGVTREDIEESEP